MGIGQEVLLLEVIHRLEEGLRLWAERGTYRSDTTDVYAGADAHRVTHP